MRNLLKNFGWATVLAMLMPIFLFTACEKEEVVLNGIPSPPTTISPANGVVIEDLKIKFTASGSRVENNQDIYYDYFLGTKKDDLKSLKDWYNDFHEVYVSYNTQYFWQAIPYTRDNTGEKIMGNPSEIFTFYTPPVSISNLESDNGETETLVVLRWEEPANCQQVNITFSPECKEVAQPIVVPAGQDSCVIRGLLDFKSLEHTFVKYTFNLEAEVKVGDKILSTPPVSIDEIPLNKTENVRDIDFNVYRCARIGNQIWLVENLRTTRRQDGTKLIEGKDFVRGSQSGTYGLYYHPEAFINRRSFTNITGPKGFKVATWDDWMLLFEELGANVDVFIPYKHPIDSEELLKGIMIGRLLKSQSGWPIVDGIDGNGIDSYHLSLLPGGYVNIDTKEEFFVGENGYYSVIADGGDGSMAPHIYRFEPFAEGMFETRLNGINGVNARCVKNIVQD